MGECYVSNQPKVPRVLRELTRANPGVSLIRGTRHWKITKDGCLVGIYPMSDHGREGFSENTKAQLRRAGISPA